MDVLNVLKELISETGKTAVKKSGEIVESTKIKFAIMSAETEISKLNREIGESIVANYKAGVSEKISADAVEKIEDVIELLNSIDELKQKINAIKDVVVCLSCEQKIPSEFAFCPRCGEKLPEEETPSDDDKNEEEAPESEN